MKRLTPYDDRRDVERKRNMAESAKRRKRCIPLSGVQAELFEHQAVVEGDTAKPQPNNQERRLF